jgi:CRISPR-associated protein Csb2
MSMFCLEVEFLLGRYAASDYRDRERAEWPPHPSRLFSALVAASYEAGLGESARAALLWLEEQPPPQICAGDATEQSRVTAFVPVNDPRHDYSPARVERQPRNFPSVVPGRQAVWFIWPESEPDDTLSDLLSRVAENVSYLGSSHSPVRVRVCAEPPGPTWVPDEAGPEVLRVPGPGRLERLDWSHRNGLRPPAGVFQTYRRVDAEPAATPPGQSHFGEMIVFRLGRPPRMEIETALKLTDAMRAAVLSLAGAGGAAVPDLLSGHGAHPHMVYAALPFVSEEERHADGHVLGTAAVLPRRADPEARRLSLQALARLDHLDVPGVGRLSLERLPASSPEPPAALRQATWVGPSVTWTSATPVLLERFPKKGSPAADIVALGCRYVGLPDPTDVQVSRFSPLYGAGPSGGFLKVRRASNLPRLSTHVTLTFGRPVGGPILLGAGRYFGLGLLRPLRGRVPRQEGRHDPR